MQTKTTHIQERRNAARTSMLQVMEATGITEFRYSLTMYLYGLTYLKEYASPRERDMYERSRIFWNWWKIQWAIREEQFLEVALKHPMGIRYWLWQKIHDPVILSGERTPNGIMLGDNWPVMRRKVQLDEAKKAEEMKWVDEVIAGINGAE